MEKHVSDSAATLMYPADENAHENRQLLIIHISVRIEAELFRTGLTT